MDPAAGLEVSRRRHLFTALRLGHGDVTPPALRGPLGSDHDLRRYRSCRGPTGHGPSNSRRSASSGDCFSGGFVNRALAGLELSSTGALLTHAHGRPADRNEYDAVHDRFIIEVDSDESVAAA